MWEVEFTDEFELWWESLTEEQRDAVDGRVLVLMNEGPDLDGPSSTTSRPRDIPT